MSDSSESASCSNPIILFSSSLCYFRTLNWRRIYPSSIPPSGFCTTSESSSSFNFPLSSLRLDTNGSLLLRKFFAKKFLGHFEFLRMKANLRIEQTELFLKKWRMSCFFVLIYLCTARLLDLWYFLNPLLTRFADLLFRIIPHVSKKM